MGMVSPIGENVIGTDTTQEYWNGIGETKAMRLVTMRIGFKEAVKMFLGQATEI